jgi:hypothetical protein
MKKIFIFLFSILGLLLSNFALANPIVLGETVYIGHQTLLFHIAKFVITLFVALLFELPIFWLFGLRKKKEFLVIALANVISVLLFYIFRVATTDYRPSSATLVGELYLQIFIAELIVVCFEAIFLKIILKKISFKKLILIVLIANIISGTFGSVLVNLLPPHPVKSVANLDFGFPPSSIQ